VKPSLFQYAQATKRDLPRHQEFWQAVEDMLSDEQRQALSDGGAVRAALWLAPEQPPAPPEPAGFNWNRARQACWDLMQVIYAHEGGTVDPYEAFNRGVAGDSLRQRWPGGGLQVLSIGEIINLQQSEKIFAVGALQVIPSTLLELLPDSGLTHEDRFDAASQDRLTLTILLKGRKRPALTRYLMGGHDQNAALDDLAYEWASLPNHTGRGWYDGDEGGNRANGELSEIKEALIKARMNWAGLRR